MKKQYNIYELFIFIMGILIVISTIAFILMSMCSGSVNPRRNAVQKRTVSESVEKEKSFMEELGESVRELKKEFNKGYNSENKKR